MRYSVIPGDQPTVSPVKCIQGSTRGKQIAFLLKLAYTTCGGFCMYVCMECRYAHRTVRFGTKYSILGDPAIPVYCLIGKKTLQRSDGLTRYVECPNRQLHYEWHQSQSHFDQSIPLLVTAPPQLSFPKRGPSSNSPETLPPTNQQYDMNTLAIECYYLPTESLICFSLI